MFKNAPFSLKLMLTLGLTVLVAAGAVAVLARLSAEQQFAAYVSPGLNQREAALLPTLVAYYGEHGEWDDVSEILGEDDEDHGWGAGQRGWGASAGAGAALTLADPGGEVEFDSSGLYPSHNVSASILKQAQPIEYQGRTVGYLLTGRGPRELAFTQNLTASIVGAGVLAGLVALLLGLLLTRAVVRPLRVVRDAAQRLGAGDLSSRVPVTSGDEIGDLARQFNEMAATLEGDEALRRKLMADVAHELRTPLAVLRAQVEALQDGVFEPTPENLTPLLQQTTLLGRLVDDLRDLALAESGQLHLERDEVDLGALLRRVVGAFQAQAGEKGVALTVETPAGPLTVCADAQRLEQILGNLLSNALRHTPSGGAVTVRGWPEGTGASFSVEDTGSGIAPQDLPHLFERFYRTDPARARADGGTGLGLSIAKQLVEAHGGTITVRSEVDRGSTFIVQLPGQA